MKHLLLLVTLFLLWNTSARACCAEDSGERLKSGFLNFVSAPLEIPKKTAYYSHETGYHPFGIAAGVGEGSVFMVQKLFTGLVQILTFPFDPEDVHYDLY